MSKYIYGKEQIILIDFQTPDSVAVSLDLGFDISVDKTYKLARVSVVPGKEKEAMEFIQQVFRCENETRVVVYPVGNKYLIDIFINGKNLNNQMLEMGLMRKFEAKGKR